MGADMTDPFCRGRETVPQGMQSVFDGILEENKSAASQGVQRLDGYLVWVCRKGLGYSFSPAGRN